LKDRYEQVQRYHVYNVGGEDTYCRDEDVTELEAKYAKLTEAHDIAVQALRYIARLYDDSKPVYQVAYDAYAMKSEAAMALEKINEVMP
jgi:outer membrane murein-binding lipoprotein Lpp